MQRNEGREVAALEKAEQAVKDLRKQGYGGTVDEAELLVALAIAEGLTAIADELRSLGAENFPIHTREV